MRVSFARGSNTLSFQIFEATKRDVYLDSRVVSHELGGVEPLRLFSVRPVLVIEQVFQLLYSSLIGCRRERERERERMHLVSLRAERTQFAALFEIRFKNRFAFFLERKKANEEDELERKKEKRGIASRVDLYLLPSVFQVDHFLVRERHPFFSSLCSSFVVIKVVYVVVYVVFKARPILFDR